MSLLRKAILVNSTEFICLALGAFRTAVLSRVLGPAGIGQYAVVLSALVLAGPLSSFGFPLSFLYYSQHDRDNVKVYLINTISSMLVLGAAGGIILAALIYFKPGYFGDIPWFALLAIGFYVPIVLQAVVGRNNLLICIEARRLSLMNLCASAASILLILTLAAFRVLSVGQALLCFIFAAVIRAGLGWSWMRANVDFSIKPTWRISRKVGLMGIRQTWADLMIVVNGQLNILIIRYLLNNFESVGYFSRGQRVAMLAVMAGQAVLPLLFSRWASFPEERLAKHVEKVLRFASTVAMIMIFGILLTGRWIILVLYGREFLPALTPMMILVPGAVLYLLSHALIQLLGSRGVPELAVLMLFCGVTVNAVLSWLLIPLMGINGAALAATTGHVVLLVSLMMTVKIRFKVRVLHCVGLTINDIKAIGKSLRHKDSALS